MLGVYQLISYKNFYFSMKALYISKAIKVLASCIFPV